MKASTNTVVSFEYTLRVDGEVVDQGQLAYLHGQNQIIEGLEEAIEGREAGEAFAVTVGPEKAYGERNPDSVQVVPLSAFPDDAIVAPGEQFYAEDAAGNPMPLTVVGVDGEQVTVDFNHPLAGKTLEFDVKIREVREATPEELAHGHVHDPDSPAH